MVQPAAADRNALHELGYKIFLDRYALKDMTRATLAVGDTVIVVVNPKTGQREVGVVEHLTQSEARIKLLDGEVVTRDIEHVDKPLETRPEQMMDRVAAGIAKIEQTEAKRAEWTDNFRWLLDGWKFVPGGRILTGAGTDQQLTYYNCMPPEQEILTADGYRPIGDVQVGEYVVTHQNRLRRVLHKFERETHEPMYVIQVEGGMFGALKLTGEHRVLTVRNDEPVWIQAQNLVLGDVLADPVGMAEPKFMMSASVMVAQSASAVRVQTPGYERLAWVSIISIETEEYTGTVLDIEVEEDHSFVTAGVVVSNCYVIPSPRDSRGGIMETLSQMTEIMSRGGGVGINISTLRPRHAYVKGVNGRSSGSVSWGALYSFVTGLIEQGGSRRGALMLILNDWHPDVFNFISSKRQAGQITNANISVGISDALMEAVKVDGDWDLLFPDTSDPDYDTTWDGDLEAWQAAGRKVHTYKTVKAREVWNAIIESAWASAEPGVWFRDRSNKLSNSHYFHKLICTNPCGEQSLPAFGICNLGALNLAAFYDADNHAVAWDSLGQAVRYGVRFLDNVIDSTPYFFEENARVQGSERRVGLGTMGIAELMVKLKIRYGSAESLEFIDQLYYFIAENAYLMSADIAAEKGAFPAFDAEQFLESGFMLGMPDHIREAVREKGIRNVTLLTQAPTGTTGTMVNTSTGIEPFFSWVYYRKSRLGLHEERMPVAQNYFDEHPGETELPDYFATAMSLSPEDHVRAQAAFQRWVDSSISKTCNVPNNYTIEQVSELYKLMYETGCKGGTIYRDGSRDEQVLMLKGDERAEKEMAEKDGKKAEAKAQQKAETPKPEAKPAPVAPTATPHRVYPRPKKLQGMTVTTPTPFGTAYVTMNMDDNGMPFEVFITAPGKAGSDLQADAEGLGRLVSLSLRTTEPHNRRQMLKLIVEQLRDIGGSRTAGFGPNRVTSLPDAVARALEDHFLTEVTPAQLSLPLAADPLPDKSKPSTSAPLTLMESPLKSNGNGNGNGTHAHDTADTPAYAGADMCPECHTISLMRVEGCRKCLTCGYSEC